MKRAFFAAMAFATPALADPVAPPAQPQICLSPQVLTAIVQAGIARDPVFGPLFAALDRAQQKAPAPPTPSGAEPPPTDASH